MRGAASRWSCGRSGRGGRRRGGWTRISWARRRCRRARRFEPTAGGSQRRYTGTPQGALDRRATPPHAAHRCSRSACCSPPCSPPASGCGPVGFPASELSSGATFAAHQVHNGFRIDRLQGGGTGVVESARWITWPGSPQFRVRAEDVPLGDLWLIAPAHVEVRERSVPGTVGDVEPAWDDGAIRLTLRPASGAPLRSGLFKRIGGILDANNRRVGWWEVYIAEPFEPRLFEGVVPQGVAGHGSRRDSRPQLRDRLDRGPHPGRLSWDIERPSRRAIGGWTVTPKH